MPSALPGELPTPVTQDRRLEKGGSVCTSFDATGLTDGSDGEQATGPSEIVPHPLIDGLVAAGLGTGVLIPLKTTMELRQDETIVKACITRVPVKAAHNVIAFLRSLHAEESAKGCLPHLRLCAKPSDLPVHLRAQFMNDSAESRQVHTGRSTWLYMLLGRASDLSRTALVRALSQVEGMEPADKIFMAIVPVPLVAPTSQMQAALWSTQFWPTLYRRNNPLGPHASIILRATDELQADVHVWMELARQVAMGARQTGMGEAIGAVVVQRAAGKAQLVAVAGDARWHLDTRSRTETGNPMAHSVLRAVSMVAQKLVRQDQQGMATDETQTAKANRRPRRYDALQDAPLLEEERQVFRLDHPNPDGYLCHGLELYVTHEPCIQCSMSVLHSRMGRVVFGDRMPLTGGMCAEDRGAGRGGPGLGLFWRRELNWSLLAWEWEPGEGSKSAPGLNARIHV